MSESGEQKLRKAREAAVALLAHRARSTREIEDRLTRKGHDRDTIRQVVSWLEELEYLDDDAFALAFVRDRIRFHPRGRRLLRQELWRKGIGRESADRAIDRALALEDLDFDELARQVARKWLRRRGGAGDSATEDGDSGGSWPRRPLSRKLRDHLARKGFGGDAQRTGLELLDSG